MLGAVTLVDQHDDVRVLVLEACGAFHRRLELVDDRRDDIRGLLLDHREEFGPRAGMAHKTVAVLEGLLDLHIQLGAVRHDDQARILELLIEGEGLAQHHHRQGLARTLGMPDHPALSASFAVALLHLFDDRLDAEELLMAGDLALAVVKEGERAGQL